MNSGLLFGFCVWGEPDMPNESIGCADVDINSHLIAFGVDVTLTAATALFWYLDPKRGDFMKVDIKYLAFGFIILMHGFLHWFLQQTTFDFIPVINCYNGDIGSEVEELGYIIFGVFSFALSLIILGFGFGLKLSTLIGSVVFTVIVVTLTKDTGGELILPGLFCIVHPLSCFTGLFSDDPIFNQNVGALFAICTIVGILELFKCDSVLRQYGGHVWYDITLHLAVVMATPYFTAKDMTGINKKRY